MFSLLKTVQPNLGSDQEDLAGRLRQKGGHHVPICPTKHGVGLHLMDAGKKCSVRTKIPPNYVMVLSGTQKCELRHQSAF
jgi:hypothetical protein